MPPLLSILIPTYNRSLYIKRCIDSVLSYNEYNIEIIVQDNCSPDNTEEIVRNIKDSRLRYYRNEENIGSIKNVINIIEKARGKYVIFLCDDDFFFPDAIEKVITFIKENNPVAFTSDIVAHFEKSKKTTIWSWSEKTLITKPEDYDNIAKIIISGGLLTRVCFERYKLDLNYIKDHTDTNMHPQILMLGYLSNKGNLGYIAEPLGIHTWENEIYWDEMKSQHSKKSWDLSKRNMAEMDNGIANIIVSLSAILSKQQIKSLVKFFSLQIHRIHPNLKQYLNIQERTILKCLCLITYTIFEMNKIFSGFIQFIKSTYLKIYKAK